uniref:Secreted phosphoprotein 24 n=1 Tax=Phocoena sinus TaxID=42100 RepID=A0A8C9B4C2_PHOSS
ILPRMEKMVMKVLIMFVLGTNYCPGFPVYDYDPSSLREAVSASVAKVNSQSLSPYLFRAFRSSVRRVNILDEDSLTMDIELRIRETTCRRGSGEDPATCDFQRGYYVPAVVCRSTVWVSAEQVQDVWVRCHWSSSSSESNSSEEVGAGARHPLGQHLPLRSLYIPFLSSGIMRRGFPPGNRRGLNLWPRARINTGFE